MWQLCCSFKGLNFLQLLHQIGSKRNFYSLRYQTHDSLMAQKLTDTFAYQESEISSFLLIVIHHLSREKKPREEHWPSYIQVKDFNFCESNNNIFKMEYIKRRIFLLERAVYSFPGSQMDLWLYDFHILILKTLIICALQPVSR